MKTVIIDTTKKTLKYNNWRIDLLEIESCSIFDESLVFYLKSTRQVKIKFPVNILINPDAEPTPEPVESNDPEELWNQIITIKRSV